MRKFIVFFVGFIAFSLFGASSTKVGGSGATKIGGSGKTKVSAFVSPIPTPDIIEWQLDEGSGTTITALVGVNGGTNSAWTTSTQSGSGAALRFNNASYIALTDSAIAYSSAETVTLSFWINRTNDSGTQIIFESSTLWDTGGGKWIAYMDSGLINVGIRDSSNLTRINTATVGHTAWHHIAAIMDTTAGGGTGSVTIYVDGALASSGDGSGSYASQTDFSDQVLFVGARDGGVAPYVGDLDHLKLYSGALTSGQISAIFAAGAQ